MKLICKPYSGIWRTYKVLTPDGFLVGIIDMRGSELSCIDCPHVTFELDRNRWRKIKKKSEGVAWLQKVWAERVRRWHADIGKWDDSK